MPNISRWVIAGFLIGAASLIAYGLRPPPIDLEAVAAFAQRLTTQYEDGIAVSARMADLEILIDSHREGAVGEEELRKTLDPAFANLRRSIDSYRAGVSVELVPPPAGNPARDRGMQALVSQVAALPDMLDSQFATLTDLRTAALADDASAYDQAKGRSLDQSADLIAAENVALEISLFSLETSHPQHGYLTAVMGSNEAMEVALRVMAASYRGQDFDAATYAADVAAALERGEQGIAGGEAAARGMERRFAEMSADTDEDSRSRDLILLLMNKYDHAFGIERRLLTVERRFLEALRAASTGEGVSTADLTQEIADLQMEIDQLVGERMAALHERLELVQELGRVQTAG